MGDLVPIRRALISVSDKTDVVAFARGLAELDVELISTGGTARTLREAGLAVTGVEAVTGFPEMMDGRIKTLHPSIHGGLLARRDSGGLPSSSVLRSVGSPWARRRKKTRQSRSPNTGGRVTSTTSSPSTRPETSSATPRRSRT